MDAPKKRKRTKRAQPAKPPDGEVTQGHLQVAIGVDKGRVVIEFETAVRWMAMSPRQARQIALSLREKALAAEAEQIGAVLVQRGGHA
jgi:hypothetical protein